MTIRDKKMTFLTLFAVLLFLAIFLTGCSSSSAPQAPSGGESTQSMNRASVAFDDNSGSSADEAPQSGLPEKSGTKADAVTEKPAQSQGTGIGNPPVQDRKMIYKADLQVEVEKYKESRAVIESLVSRFHGYILASSDFENEREKGGQITVRIPQTGFSSFLTELDKVATKIPSRNIVGQDVTEEYVDLTSRLKALQVVEARLLQFMSNAQKTEDLLKISTELGKVQEEIEQIKGRMRYLDENISYSTIELSLVEKKITAKLNEVADQGTWHKAWLALNKSLLGILAFLNGLIVVLAGSLPVLILLAVIFVPLFFYWRRKRRTQLPTTPPSSHE